MGKPMTRERLEYYRKAQADLAALNELAAQKARDKVKGSMEEHPYTKVDITVCGLDEKLVRRIQRKRTQIAAEKQEIVKFLDGLDDLYLAELLSERYLGGASWPEIWEMHGCRGTVDSYRIAASRCLKKLFARVR